MDLMTDNVLYVFLFINSILIHLLKFLDTIVGDTSS